MKHNGPHRQSKKKTWESESPTNAMLVFLVCFGLGLVGALANQAGFLPGSSGTWATFLIATIGLGYAQFFVRGLARNSTLSLEEGVLFFHGVNLPSIALADASLALKRWMTPGFGTRFGTILVITADDRVVTIGGAGHSVRHELPESDEQTPDFYLGADSFASLLKAVDPTRALAHPTESSDGRVEPQTIALTNNVTRSPALLAAIAPWLLTMAAIAALSGVSSSMGLTATPEGQRALGFVSVFLAVAGIVLTVVWARRAPPSPLRLVISDRFVELRSSRPGAVDSVAERAELRLTRGTHTLTSRHSANCFPVLVIEGLGSKPLSVGVLDPQYLWSVDTPDLPAPKFIVGAADWAVLVRALGVPADGTVGPG